MGAVVLFDLLPSALVAGGFGITVVGSGCGMVLLALFNHLVLKRDDEDSSLAALGYLIMLGIAVHDLPEGTAIALGQEMKARTGMVIAMGIGIHNIPEGMAIAAPLLMAGISRIRILLQAVMVGLITPLGTVLGKVAAHYSPGCLPFYSAWLPESWCIWCCAAVAGGTAPQFTLALRRSYGWVWL